VNSVREVSIVISLRLLQFTPTGSIDPTMPILMLAVIFGLPMDYEVFLLSRIRERLTAPSSPGRPRVRTVALATAHPAFCVRVQ